MLEVILNQHLLQLFEDQSLSLDFKWLIGRFIKLLENDFEVLLVDL